MIATSRARSAHRHAVVHAWALLGLLVALLSPRVASAQAQPLVDLSVEAPTVGLGDPFDVRLVAQAEEMPRFPELELPAGLVASRPSLSTSTNVSIMNGVRTDRLGLEAHWTVRASQTGTFTLGPATVRVGDRVLTSRRVTVRVVPEAPRDARPGRRSRPSVFDPFGMFGGSPFDDPFRDTQPQQIFEPETDPAFALDAPPSPGVFLVAKCDKGAAFVGEQVTYTVLLYADARLQDPQFTDLHEAPAPHFLRQSLLDDTQPPKLLAHARVGSGLFRVYQLRRVALFPLNPGVLTVAPMRLQFVGPRGGERLSRAVDVRVAEAPLKGRPAGYAAGSVGTFALSVEVSPRAVDQHGTIVVKATLDGRGNPPPRLLVPEGADFEWLEPDVSDAFAADDQGRWAGRRTWTWAVRAKAAGEKNLGALKVGIFDPERRAFASVEAALGAVRVAAHEGPVTREPQVHRGLEGLPAPFGDAPEPSVVPLASPVPRVLFAAPALLVLALPLVAFVAGVGRASRDRVRAILQRKPSLSRVLASLEREAAKAAPAAVEGLTTRVVDELASSLAGRATRGLRDEELLQVLRDAMPGDDADRMLLLLRDARDARFSGLTSPVDARKRFDETLAIARKYAGKVRS